MTSNFKRQNNVFFIFYKKKCVFDSIKGENYWPDLKKNLHLID